MLKHIRPWIVALLLTLSSLTLAACGRSEGLDTPTPTSSGPRILFEDDFSDDTSGWLEAADAQSSQGYRNGQFFFEVQAPDLIVWDNAGGNFQDFAMEVEARQVSGAAENSFGALFRYIDGDNFYRFDLTGDGHYAVLKSEHSEWNTLADWQAAVDIKPLGEVNLVKIVCRGPRTTFYVNGQELIAVEDDSFERGDVGLFASTFSEPNVEVEFDDLEIWAIE